MDQLQQKLNKAKAFDMLIKHLFFSNEGKLPYEKEKISICLTSKDTMADIHIHLTKEEYEILKKVGIVEV